MNPTGPYQTVEARTGAMGMGAGTGALGAGTGGKGARVLNVAEALIRPDPIPKSTSKPTVEGSSISIAVLASVE
jgi:hypothetical protein